MRLPSGILIFDAERARMRETNERRRNRQLPPEVLFLALVVALALVGYVTVTRSAGGTVFKSDLAPRCADAPVPCRGRA